MACVGPSGAGKTTLLDLLNGTNLPVRGRVELEGRDVSSLSAGARRAARSRIGFIHQQLSLDPNLRVSQNVVAGRLGRRGILASLRSLVRPSASDLEEVHAILERLGIEEKLFERTSDLSGGEQQRVAVARALFQQPTALLADEPVASVDPARARALIRLLSELAREDGLALVVSLHDLELAREFFPRAVGLRGGRVLFDRATAEVSERDWADLYQLEPGDG